MSAATKSFHIEQPLDPNLITRTEAAVILGTSAVTVAKIDGLTEYWITQKAVFLDRREVEAYAETHPKKGRK